MVTTRFFSNLPYLWTIYHTLILREIPIKPFCGQNNGKNTFSGIKPRQNKLFSNLPYLWTIYHTFIIIYMVTVDIITLITLKTWKRLNLYWKTQAGSENEKFTGITGRGVLGKILLDYWKLSSGKFSNQILYWNISENSPAYVLGKFSGIFDIFRVFVYVLGILSGIFAVSALVFQNFCGIFVFSRIAKL